MVNDIPTITFFFSFDCLLLMVNFIDIFATHFVCVFFVNFSFQFYLVSLSWPWALNRVPPGEYVEECPTCALIAEGSTMPYSDNTCPQVWLPNVHSVLYSVHCGIVNCIVSTVHC